jgi:Domain of unknown function (DUF4143)
MSAAGDRAGAFLMGLWAVEGVDMVGAIWMNRLSQMVPSFPGGGGADDVEGGVRRSDRALQFFQFIEALHGCSSGTDSPKLAASLAVSGQTVARYLDLLCDLMLVRRLRPWAANEGKRLVRVRDSGIAHALLGLTDFDDVIGHPVVGGSWEGWLIENLLAVAPPATQAYFYRSSKGAEIDLVLELPQAPAMGDRDQAQQRAGRKPWPSHCRRGPQGISALCGARGQRMLSAGAWRARDHLGGVAAGAGRDRAEPMRLTTQGTSPG